MAALAVPCDPDPRGVDFGTAREELDRLGASVAFSSIMDLARSPVDRSTPRSS